MSFEKLGDICDVIDSLHKTPKYSDIGKPMVRCTDVKYGELNLSNTFKVSDEVFNEFSKRYNPEVNDIIITRVGSYGITAQVKDINFCLGQNTSAIKPKNINPDYLYLVLNSKVVKDQIEFSVVGSTQKTLSLKAINNLDIPRFGDEIENQIAIIGASLDDKIVNNAQTNQTLEQMAQAIFKSWFVDFDPVKAKMNGEQPEGMDAATASLFPEKLVESELGLIPEGWAVDQIGNHIDVTKGKSYKSAELQESTTALVTLKSFKRGGGYRMDGLKEYTGKYKPQQVIEAGDLVMSLTDVTQAAEIVGKPALVIDAPQYDTLVASLDVAILRPKETDAKQYFYGLMSTYRFHRYAESFATGTTVLHLSPKGITTFEFACPSAELVEKYHEFATPIFAKIEANILESQELAKLRDTLLPKLLSGEIELVEQS
ncbi:TPA: restriction endonuclease subunit S [Vibrio parahaemolyticus]|nr:restriction endonuclease subunit S [Vibrio parahaemolyticus]